MLCITPLSITSPSTITFSRILCWMLQICPLWFLLLYWELWCCTPRVNLIKLFCCKFTHTFCKLDRFINANNNCLSAVKSSSSKTKANKLQQKCFMRSTPCTCITFRLGQLHNNNENMCPEACVTKLFKDAIFTMLS
jgi:hypothetical protein